MELRIGDIAMTNLIRRLTTCALLASVLATLAVISVEDAHAQQSVADFYKGKQMKFIIRAAPGGGYDLYSRLIAAHIVHHIPGNPTIIPQNMPGAGGLQAANFVGDIAPRDGTILTMISQALPMDQSLGFTPQFKADLSKFGWIGNLGDSNLLTYVWHTSLTHTMEDAKKRETTLGGSGAGSVTTWLPLVYNNVLGTKFKMINGYKSANDVRLAMERGEVEGYAANPWNSLLSADPELVKEHKLTFLVQVGVKKEKDLPNVPLLPDLASNGDQRAILDFICNAFSVGRPIATTPGVPPERLAALRQAFNDTLVDPAFIEAAAKINAEIKPVYGDELQTLMSEVIHAPQSIKDKVKRVMPPR
jgi:tripartite-type tricarboxylate transporter receptor subunit TctC